VPISVVKSPPVVHFLELVCSLLEERHSFLRQSLFQTAVLPHLNLLFPSQVVTLGSHIKFLDVHCCLLVECQAETPGAPDPLEVFLGPLQLRVALAAVHRRHLLLVCSQFASIEGERLESADVTFEDFAALLHGDVVLLDQLVSHVELFE